MQSAAPGLREWRAVQKYFILNRGGGSTSPSRRRATASCWPRGDRKDGTPYYHYNFFKIERTSIKSSVTLPKGRSTVSFEFEYDGGGAGKGGEAVLFVDDKEVGRKRIERTVAGRFGIDTFGVGCDTGSPVCKHYKPPYPFSGVIVKVDILLGDAGLSEEEERVMQEKFHAGVNY
jgi:arylsulfatase